MVLLLNLLSARKTSICPCALLGLVFGQHDIEENLGFKNILDRGLNSKFAMNSRNLLNFFTYESVFTFAVKLNFLMVSVISRAINVSHNFSFFHVLFVYNLVRL